MSKDSDDENQIQSSKIHSPIHSHYYIVNNAVKFLILLVIGIFFGIIFLSIRLSLDFDQTNEHSIDKVTIR